MPKPIPILVVDPDPDSRNLVAEYLSLCGFPITTAADGTAAVSAAMQVHPRVVVVEATADGADAWEAPRQIKANPDTRDAVVMAVTSHGFPQEIAEARRAGCDYVFIKPIQLPRLVEHINRIADDPERPDA